MGILDFLFRRSAPVQMTLPAAVDRFADLREQRDLRWRRWLQNLEHPFELVPGARAQAAFEAARTLGRTQNFSPLIVQPGFDTPIRAEPISLKDSKVRIAEEYFEWRARELAADTDDLTLFDQVSEVEQTAAEGLSMIDMLSETRPLSLHAEVAILRLPCAESWKIPLFVPVVPPDNSRSEGEEIGIQKQWYERFGAELCCIGDRSWQFRVTRPPRDHDEAVELLRQHYLYAWLDDAYEQETIENSAAALQVSTHWMFFWQ
jgi:Domain of unknown function (DUF4253)